MDKLTEQQVSLIESNANLVPFIYEKYFKHNTLLRKQEFISAGNLGLVRASALYKPELNTKFSSYASNYIYWEMHKEATSKYNNSKKEISIDSPVKDQKIFDNSLVLGDEIIDYSQNDMDDTIDAKQLVSKISNLKPIYMSVAKLLYLGYNNAEIGRQLNLSRERVRVIVCKLRNYLNKEKHIMQSVE